MFHLLILHRPSSRDSILDPWNTPHCSHGRIVLHWFAGKRRCSPVCADIILNHYHSKNRRRSSGQITSDAECRVAVKFHLFYQEIAALW